MLASPASTTVRTSNGWMSRASEWIEPEVYCASRIARGPNRAPERWVTASSNGAPMIATSTPACRIAVGIGHPGQVHEGGWPDVGRQIEVGECLEVGIPAIPARVPRVGGIEWALSHGGTSEDGRGFDAPRSGPSRWGAPPVRPTSSGARRLDSSRRIRPASQFRCVTCRSGTPPRLPQPGPGRDRGRARSGR